MAGPSLSAVSSEDHLADSTTIFDPDNSISCALLARVGVRVRGNNVPARAITHLLMLGVAIQVLCSNHRVDIHGDLAVPVVLVATVFRAGAVAKRDLHPGRRSRLSCGDESAAQGQSQGRDGAGREEAPTLPDFQNTVTIHFPTSISEVRVPWARRPFLPV